MTFGRTLAASAVFLAIFLVGLQYAYYSIFTQFRPYDDEGTMLLRVAMLVKDPASYDSLSGVYGPFYYLHKYALHAWLGLPVGHDINRLTTVVLWGLAAAGCGLFVHRLTRSLVLAAIVQMQLLLHLRTFINEPGHPHEIALFLLAGALVSSGFVTRRSSAWAGLAGLGAATGALVLVKINLGAYLAIPVAAACLYALPRTGWSTAWRWSVACLSVLVPPAVLWRHIHDPWGWNYAALTMLVVAASFVATARRPAGEAVSWSETSTLAATASLTVVLVCGVILSWGNSIASIANSVFRRAASFSATFVIPAPIGDDLVHAAAVSLLLAIAWATTAPWLRAREATRFAIAGVKIAYGCYAFYWLAILGPGLLRQSWSLPLLWLVVIDADGDRSPREMMPRVLLCVLAAFQMLQAYPVHGSQATWAVFLIAPLSAVCIGDALHTLAGIAHARGWQMTDRWRVARAVLVAILLLIAFRWYDGKADIPGLKKAYAEQTPLDLPGASRMRIGPGDAAQLRWLAKQVRANCDGFVGLPGFGSLYFWTEIPPPASMNSAWMLNLEDEHQQAIVDRMRTYRSPCVVRNPGMLGFWLGGRPLDPDMPLVRYIRENFRAGPQFGAYTLLLPAPSPDGGSAGRAAAGAL